MKTERLCSQENFLLPTAVLGERHLFHFHTLLCSVRSSTQRKTCHCFVGKGEILFMLELVARNFKKDHRPSPCSPTLSQETAMESIQTLAASKTWPLLQNMASRCRHPSHQPSHISDQPWILKDVGWSLLLCLYSDGLCLCPIGPVH